MAKKEKVISKEDLERMKVFEKASDSYKSIFTKDGLSLEGLVNLVENCLQLCDEEEKIWWGHQVAFAAILHGSKNYYEAMGVLEACKDEYQRYFHEVTEEDED